MMPYVETLGKEVSRRLTDMGYECKLGPSNLMGNTVVYRLGKNLGFEVSVPGTSPNNGCLFGPCEPYPKPQEKVFKDLLKAAKMINHKVHSRWGFVVVPDPDVSSSIYLIYATDAKDY